MREDDQRSARAIEKGLSANDTGKTGAHQAGMHIPKQQDILSFFPSLPEDEVNPRRELRFVDDFGETWNLMFIYYNNRRRGGTRNEFRLTRMTGYIARHRLQAGDTIKLSRDDDGRYTIGHVRWTQASRKDGTGPLRLGARWVVIAMR